MSFEFQAPSTGAEVDHTITIRLDMAGETFELGKVTVDKAGNATVQFKPSSFLFEAVGILHAAIRKAGLQGAIEDDSDEDST